MNNTVERKGFFHEGIEKEQKNIMLQRSTNFTTGGIYHLHGSAMINHTVHAWSLVLKVIQQASSEKDNPQHHNYWCREALIYEAELLSSLPDEIYAPNGYFVEEQKDGTIWIWMEYLEGTPPSSQAQFEYVARLLGRFNAAYLAGSRAESLRGYIP